MKPVNKNQETAQRELEEAMKKVKEAQSLILAAVEPGECHTPVCLSTKSFWHADYIPNLLVC